jgi:hypothetical protein
VNSKPVEALLAVAGDLKAAVAHYESWRLGGREYILQKYHETISWIAWNPDAFPRKIGAVQRAVLKQSYYMVYFVQESERSLVLAVLDGRRNPAEIRGLVNFRRKVGSRP